MLFGDAGSAILLERSKTEKPSYFHLKSIGKEWKKITTPAGGFRLPIRKDIIDLEIKDPEGNIIHLWDSVMKGGAIFKFAIEQGPETINKILQFSGKNKDDIDFFAIHQANGQIVRTVINHAGLPKDKASSETFSKFGNCGGTSVLVNFCDQMKGKSVKNVLMVTFGGGLSVGTCILDFSETYNGGICYMKTPQALLTREQLVQEWVDYLSKGNV